ncbi:hypothetical protein VUR80DRAFT_10312 [Thermomyces stellatus]
MTQTTLCASSTAPLLPSSDRMRPEQGNQGPTGRVGLRRLRCRKMVSRVRGVAGRDDHHRAALLCGTHRRVRLRTE